MGPLLPLLIEAAKATATVAGAVGTVNALANNNSSPQPPAVVEVKKKKKKKPKPIVIQQPQPQSLQQVPPVNLVININIYKDGKKVCGSSSNNKNLPKIEANDNNIDVGIF